MTNCSVAYLCTLLLGVSAGCAPTARDVWTKALSRCATSDLLRKDDDKLLYLGPSNPYGPGSGWRVVVEDGSLEPRFSLSDAADAKTIEQLILRGKEVTCDLAENETFSISPKLLLQSVTVPLNADAKADIQRASRSNVKVPLWRVDTLNEIAYEKWIRSPESGDYGKDILKQPGLRRVMKRAILVRDFSAELTYGTNDSATISGKYTLNKAVDVGGGLTLVRTGNSTLTLQSKEEFYIVGTLLPLRDDGTFGVLAANAPQGSLAEIRISPTQQIIPKRE